MTEEIQEDRIEQLCERCKREDKLIMTFEGYICADCLVDMDL